MRTIGVYAIVNLATGQRYIGSSVHISNRWSDHLSRLRHGTHHCAGLQRDWSSLGAESFGWIILETLTGRDERVPAEQRWLTETPSAYNASRRAGGGPRDGFAHTEVSKAKMSARCSASWAHRSRTLTPEHREKVRVAGIGRVQTAQKRAKVSAALKGRVITWGAKISAANTGRKHLTHRSGWTLSAAVRAKMSLARTGRTHTAETKAKIGAAHKGVPNTPEANAANALVAISRGRAISRGKIGKPWSVDHWHAYALKKDA